MRHEGSIVIVTGAARGIGAAISAQFQEEGAHVVGLDLIGPEASAPPAANREEILWNRCDVTNESAVEEAISAIGRRFGRIDVLVSNAGVNAYFAAETMTSAEWDTFMAIDLKAAWMCAKHAIPHLKPAGEASIINISSLHARLTTPGMFPYAAAKAGLVGLTRSLALDLAPHGIRVNAVCPGYIRTRLYEKWLVEQADPNAAEAAVIAVHPLGRIGKPDDVANLVTFLASSEASFITGAAFEIDGGLGAQFAT